ncbi:MAG: 1-deoxy-D-xylulose-5-phosphate reductoisomerase [Candidatus Brocadiia bacterium]
MVEEIARKVIVLGSTGSIGNSTLDVVRGLSGRIEVVGLSACSRWKELAEQVREFNPFSAAIADLQHKSDFSEAVGEENVELYFGPDGICKMLENVEADIIVGAITGWAGFGPSVRTLELGLTLALANKETLVVGGPLVNRLARQNATSILPVDSEQSAIFQAMASGKRAEVRRVILTGSGGPFRGRDKNQLRDVTPTEALNHPTWDMGRKITIDSATMMNKALEVIETRWLFDLEVDQIDVLVHPQSIIHSLVEFVDGSVLAQLGVPDMKLPIQYALTYPDRIPGPVERLDLTKVGNLDLEEPDYETFPALEIGYRVARRGGTSGAVLNAANEVAVEQFLREQIAFTDITGVARKVLDEHDLVQKPDLADLEAADRWAREEARRCCAQL